MLSLSMQYIFCDISVRPTVIETAIYVNSIGPVDPINMVRVLLLTSFCILSAVEREWKKQRMIWIRHF